MVFAVTIINILIFFNSLVFESVHDGANCTGVVSAFRESTRCFAKVTRCMRPSHMDLNRDNILDESFPYS